MSVPSRAAVRTYVATVVLLGFGYAGFVFLTTYALRTWDGSPWRYGVSLLPVLPIVLGWPAVTRMFKAYDELQRKLAGEALQTAFGVTAVVTFAYGWLQWAGLPPINLTFVFPFMWVVFGVAYGVRHGRYSR